ncbi:transcription-repair coupling factor (superfamily II helicase) [Salibacterium salarium]|uniref:transcription-repair coupling factor n=1 Tax=Salibacterium salarium TaxID=284579 RepID=UPI00278494F7|nr:transcription-repair coupling factor [Salibacterium salarium]MDQ0300961.1 transcription-repair coupling factor (superfamily II helicase) [Salibacterium salarium]
MKGLQQALAENDHVKAVLDGVENGMKEQLAAGLTGSARPFFMSLTKSKVNHPQLIITHTLYQAQKLYEDIVDLVEHDVYLYPVNELISSEIATASPEMRAQRIEVLNKLMGDFNGIVIAPIAGVRRLLPPVDLWRDSQFTIRQGEEIDLETFIPHLFSLGYQRADMVSAPGEFSVRGGIIDVYSLTEENPVRIELFDTEIDSLRHFQADDQRSLEQLKEITIGPAQETILYSVHFEKAAAQLEQSLADTLSRVKDNEVKEKLQEHLGYEKEQLAEQSRFQGLYKYMEYFYEQPVTLLSYFSENTILFLDEISRVQEMAENLDKEEAEWATTVLEQGEIPSDLSLSVPFDKLFADSNHPRIYLSLFLRNIPSIQPQNIANIQCKAMQQFHGQMHVLKSEMNRWQQNNYNIVFIAGDQDRAQKLQNVLYDYDMEAEIIDRAGPFTPKKPAIIQGQLNSGFELPMEKVVVITEEETFTKKVNRPQRRQKLSNAERIKSYSELKVGDLVVHVNHGIGKYLGIETLEVKGVHQDYLNISYRGNDKLYVPVEQIDLVQKYVGSEEKEPKIHALGGSEWKKVKRRVESSVQDIAEDLIKLYSEREASKGHAFANYEEEEQAFADTFSYQETEDQLKAIREIKEDMERERPMDRLLCGDVGYGKTEVAIRAAFKAILDGKQVALLVPTTILAQQHFDTLTERFADYPINIGMLSRFRTRKQQSETIKSLKTGGLDIVVGTHRILSKDITFKDLGLLIVDEEQRFGVTHKEKIKRLKANIDVLTLTATPIPRTLHMSMLGVRDLSVIETPPENRFPVQTYVMDYNASLVKEAVERELSRGGQVYLLYNRVDDISRMADQVSMLVPDAEVAYAHGQMNEQELESVMIDFLEGDKNVLVTTTIIETGVDIPNVNTLIIYNADKMGLSQLYQIRGRVGRSNRVAYAYFTYQRDKILTEIAEKRLQAIKEFTELGSGFKIAMRDLSIRGTGNLLGAEQHGFIESVGFDMYSEMLKEAIEEQKGQTPKSQEREVEIDVKMDAYIPGSYISDSKQKIEMYKRFKGLETIDELQDLQDEMIDRFGEYPQETADLFALSKVKLSAKKNGVESIVQEGTKTTVLLTEDMSQAIDGSKLFEVVNEFGREVGIGASSQSIKIAIHQNKMTSRRFLEILETLVQKLPETVKEAEETPS